MKRIRRRVWTPAKKWSMFEKWLGARITGPRSGMLGTEIALAR